MKLNICRLCIHEDFGYCGLRNEEKDLKYKHLEDEDGNHILVKCSGFRVDTDIVNTRFRLEEK